MLEFQTAIFASMLLVMSITFVLYLWAFYRSRSRYYPLVPYPLAFVVICVLLGFSALLYPSGTNTFVTRYCLLLL